MIECPPELSNILADGEYHYLAITFDGTHTGYYIDGSSYTPECDG